MAREERAVSWPAVRHGYWEVGVGHSQSGWGDGYRQLERSAGWESQELLELEVWEGLWTQWGVTVFGQLSPLVLCLFLLGGHVVHEVASHQQGLVGEFCADPGQEFFRTG